MFSNIKITQNGKSLKHSKYTIDYYHKTFASHECNLVIDFSDECDWIFKIHYNCTIITDSNCSFNAKANCTFKTGRNCNFKTLDHCTFDTERGCFFDTTNYCTFKTKSYCNFDTGSKCNFVDTGCRNIFNTGDNCTFLTDDSCVFNTLKGCTFKTGTHCTFNTESGCKFNTGDRCIFLIYHDGFIKCKGESVVTILISNQQQVNITTPPNKIVEFWCKQLTVWENKNLILKCKIPKYKDVCSFYLKTS